MANRNTLHISKLEAFKNWLIKDGWEILPLSKNPYEVLRASKIGISNPLIVYSGKSKENLSFANEWLPVVKAFLHKKTNADRIRSMTENKAIEELHRIRPYGGIIPQRRAEALDVAIKALKEVQQYHQIGTVEECREAVEKQTAKKPDYEGDGFSDGQLVYDTWICPCCGKHYEVDCDRYYYCQNCGQHIDWSDEE